LKTDGGAAELKPLLTATAAAAAQVCAEHLRMPWDLYKETIYETERSFAT